MRRSCFLVLVGRRGRASKYQYGRVGFQQADRCDFQVGYLAWHLRVSIISVRVDDVADRPFSSASAHWSGYFSASFALSLLVNPFRNLPGKFEESLH